MSGTGELDAQFHDRARMSLKAKRRRWMSPEQTEERSRMDVIDTLEAEIEFLERQNRGLRKELDHHRTRNYDRDLLLQQIDEMREELLFSRTDGRRVGAAEARVVLAPAMEEIEGLKRELEKVKCELDKAKRDAVYWQGRHDRLLAVQGPGGGGVIPIECAGVAPDAC